MLLFFGYDDIFRIISSPLMFYPLLLIFALVALAFSLGGGAAITQGLLPMVRMSLNMGLRKVGIPF